MKKYIHICFLLIFFITVGCHESKPDIVAWVNDESITKAELQHWMLLEKANVFNHFFRKYGVEDHEHFWTQKYGNEIPLETLKKHAIDHAKRSKIQQLLALEKEIIKTVNFDEIVEEMEMVNAKRKMKVDKGEPIYGPIQFTSRTYFYHVFNKMVIQLKDELSKKELKPSNEELTTLQKDYGQVSTDNTGFLIMQYVDAHYEAYIDNLMSDMNIKVNEDVYAKIGMN